MFCFIHFTELDVYFVLQIHRQFPLSFEFNQYYLKFIAYHYVSCRFRTFMLDNECERVEAGWLLEERHRSQSVDMGSDTDSLLSERVTCNGTSIWDYIDMYNKRSPIFFNFLYSPMEQDSVSLNCFFQSNWIFHHFTISAIYISVNLYNVFIAQHCSSVHHKIYH